jgi:uroporphyrinogen-III synthase
MAPSPASLSDAPAAPRHGRRALVTRPLAEAAGVAAALAARGVAALIEPLIEIDFRAGTPPELAGAQALLCTSANGVRALARLTGERGLPLFAVGEATAARARAEGFLHVESAGGNVDDLALLAADRLDPAGGRLIHIAGSAVAGDLAAALGGRGFTVERAVLYEARPVPALGAECVRALSAGMVDFALFFSPRTAAVFARLAGQAGIVAALRFASAVSISDAADRELAGLQFRDRRVASRPDQEGLLRALDRLLAERRCA